MMFARFALLLLVCALVVPKAAWGAHLAGHEQMTSASAVHTHHADHAHEHADDSAAADEHGADGTSPDEGLTHDHSPSLSMATAMLTPDDPQLSSWFAPTDLRFARSFAAAALSRPESLLRPPRAA